MFFRFLKGVSYAVLALGALGLVIVLLNHAKVGDFGFDYFISIALGTFFSFIILHALALIGEETVEANEKLYMLQKKVAQLAPDEPSRFGTSANGEKSLLERLKNQ